MKLRVSLNGTDKNPYAVYGLTQNPFPQIGKYELLGAMSQLNKLGGPPIPRDRFQEYIRETLRGWSEEFIELCIRKFEVGKYVKFVVQIPGD